MVDFYPNYTNLSASTIVNGNKLEQLALDRCSLAVYSSEWAAESAIRNYNVHPDKVKVIPFGANLECSRSYSDIQNIIRNRPRSVSYYLWGLIGIEKVGNWH